MFLKKYFLHLEKKNRLGSYEENNSYHSLIPCYGKGRLCGDNPAR